MNLQNTKIKDIGNCVITQIEIQNYNSLVQDFINACANRENPKVILALENKIKPVAAKLKNLMNSESSFAAYKKTREF
jgi:hypothetical protein